MCQLTLAQVQDNAARIGAKREEQGKRRSRGVACTVTQGAVFLRGGEVSQSPPGRLGALNPAAWEGERDLKTV